MPIMFGMLRHLVSGLGMVLVLPSIMDTNTVAQALGHMDAVVGAIMFFGGLAASAWNKMRS